MNTIIEVLSEKLSKLFDITHLMSGRSRFRVSSVDKELLSFQKNMLKVASPLHSSPLSSSAT